MFLKLSTILSSYPHSHIWISSMWFRPENFWTEAYTSRSVYILINEYFNIQIYDDDSGIFKYCLSYTIYRITTRQCAVSAGQLIDRLNSLSLARPTTKAAEPRRYNDSTWEGSWVYHLLKTSSIKLNLHFFNHLQILRIKRTFLKSISSSKTDLNALNWDRVS